MSRSLTDADAAGIDAMVQHSSARNAADGITGMLWFDGASFVQVLEGDHERVDELMSRVITDPRHTDLQVVLDREVQGRAFGVQGMSQPDDGPESLASTAFLVGLTIARGGPAARRLHDVVVACELQ